MTDIDLLRREMATLWGTDDYGRHEPEPLVAVAEARDGRQVRTGAALPDRVRRQLATTTRPNLDPAAEAALTEAALTEAAPTKAAPIQAAPAELVRARTLLGGSTRVTCGPSYLIEHAARPTAPVTIVGSDRPAPPMIRPERWWQPQEWAELLAGGLGPWAAVVDAGHVRALCHTPRAHDGCAEAGVWTHPDHRRRGHSQVVTLALAAIARHHYDVLFYSTADHNHASQAVAHRLGLRPLGQIWQLHP